MCSLFGTRRDINNINLWRRVKRERGVESARGTRFLFFWDLSLFFFCLRTIKFFSRRSKSSRFSVAARGRKNVTVVCFYRWLYCGVHVRGFCERGVFFNEHNNTTRFTKKRDDEGSISRTTPIPQAFEPPFITSRALSSAKRPRRSMPSTTQ